MKKLLKALPLVVVLLLLAGFSTKISKAQDVTATSSASIGVAVYVPVTDDVVDTNVICSTEGGDNMPCTREYDPNMLGVLTENPSVFIGVASPSAGTKAVISSGQAEVLVSSQNGDIKAGDFITSSRTKGVAQKATKSGFILGSAMEDYSNSDTSQTGKILVTLSIRPAVLKAGAGLNLLQVIKDGVQGAFESPLSALRYTVAALIVSVVFIYGFIHFGKVAKSGVESIGRNPLATKSIQAGVIMNMGVIIAIMGASIFVAYLILVI